MGDHADRYLKGIFFSTIVLFFSVPLILGSIGLSSSEFIFGLLVAEAAVLLTGFVSVGAYLIWSRRAGVESANLERMRFRLAVLYFLFSIVLVAAVVISYLSRG